VVKNSPRIGLFQGRESFRQKPACSTYQFYRAGNTIDDETYLNNL